MGRIALLGTCLLLLSACSEPMIVLPGGALEGEVIDPPPDWTELNEAQVIQLETRPDDPYSINIWAAGIGPHIYIATSEDGTRWTEHIAANRDVRIRIEGQIYGLEAVAVLDREERQAVVDEYVRKYDVDDDDDESWVDVGMIFRLDRR